MSGLTLTVQTRSLVQAMQKGPALLEQHMRRAVLRTVMEISRDARQKAPKAFSTLTHAIKHRMPQPLVGEVVAGVDYAQMVEEGTGSGGYPGVQVMTDWIRVKNITPNDPTMDQRDLAFVMARSVAMKGIPAQPYMQPALDGNKAQAERRIGQAIDNALREMSA